MTMTQRVGTWVAATVLSAAGGLVPVARAQERPAASPAQAKPSRGMGEGIQVHGRWTIEVRNPDGSLASRYAFQNDLDPFPPGRGGNFALSGLLTRSLTAGAWFVQLDNFAGGPGGAGGTCGSNNPCTITEDIPGMPALSYFFRTLTVTGNPAGTIELSGNATMARAGSIVRVSTRLNACPPTTAPSACSSDQGLANNIYSFTMRSLSTPIPVTPGQIVQVTVILSFS